MFLEIKIQKFFDHRIWVFPTLCHDIQCTMDDFHTIYICLFFSRFNWNCYTILHCPLSTKILAFFHFNSFVSDPFVIITFSFLPTFWATLTGSFFVDDGCWVLVIVFGSGISDSLLVLKFSWVKLFVSSFIWSLLVM